MTAERPRAPDPTLILFIRLTSALSKFRNIYHLTAHRSRLTLAVTAAIVAAAGGVPAGLAAASPPAASTPPAAATSAVGPYTASAAGNPRATGHPGPVHAGHARGVTLGSAARPARAGQAAPARAASRQAVRVPLDSGAWPIQPGGAPRPAASGRTATSGTQAAPEIPAAVRQVAFQRPAGPQRLAGTQRPARLQGLARTRHAAVASPRRPYYFYDSVTPWAIPAREQIATYATGNYAISPRQLAGRGRVMWIDVFGNDTAASALDVEPGDATPTVAASWALHKLGAQPRSVAHIYTMISEWPAVKAAVAATLPSWMRSRIRWWIRRPDRSTAPGARLRCHPVVLGPELRHQHRDAGLLRW
ncbi:MAG: hypothetical protein JO242_07850 [Streptosporangiaceae bacterium]|nr:hypothetical protein [Streptosporangiaceae bacterium]